MCGLFGIVSSKEEWLRPEYATELKHRGPDDSGQYSGANIRLFHYRLAIQDLSAKAHQPMISGDGRFVLIFNGEIYNHWELRKDLLQDNNFKSSSDTETILVGFERFGTEFFRRLNGIFALAIYDKETNILVLARDQFGLKPLYYYLDPNCFAFSSEIKAFLQIPSFDRTLNFLSFARYIQFLWSPGTSTAFRCVSKLSPGHYMSINLDQPENFICHAYFEAIPSPLKEKHTESEWVDKVDDCLQTAVRRQLLSDVPVAYFVSGGLDSSLIAAIARQLKPHENMHGFTVANAFTKNDGFADDLPYAKMLADHLNMQLHVTNASMNPVLELDDMIWHLDEPLADAAPLLVSQISCDAKRRGFSVLLSGTGGDDLFTGYQRHKALALDRFLFKLPIIFRRGIAAAAASLPTSHSGLRRLKKYLEGSDAPNLKYRICNYLKWLPDEKLLNLFSKNIQAELNLERTDQVFMTELERLPEQLADIEKMLHLELNFFLPDHNLNYIDKMSMKHGVEVRVPFLDPDLVLLSNQIPASLKMRNHTTKYILRKVAERYLPHELIRRPKTGFGGPVRNWIRYDYKERMSADFESGLLRNQGIFNPDAIHQLIDQNEEYNLDAAYSIFALLAIQSWLKQFYEEKEELLRTSL